MGEKQIRFNVLTKHQNYLTNDRIYKQSVPGTRRGLPKDQEQEKEIWVSFDYCDHQPSDIITLDVQ